MFAALHHPCVNFQRNVQKTTETILNTAAHFSSFTLRHAGYRALQRGLSMSSVWISKLGMSLFRKVPESLPEFRQDINRLSPFRSSRVAVSRPCRLSEFTPFRALDTNTFVRK